MNDKRALTSPINGRLSAGPQTAAGKARSSRNATTHGILSRELILPGENRLEYEQLLSSLLDELRPVGVVEAALVERIAVSMWRQRRLIRAENAQIFRAQSAVIPDSIFNETRSIHDVRELLEELRTLSTQPGFESWPLQQFQARYPHAYQLMTETAVSTDPEDLLGAQNLSMGEVYPGVMGFAARQYAIWEDRLDALLQRDGMSVLSNPHSLSRYHSKLDNDFYKAWRAFIQARDAREKVIDIKSQAVAEGAGK